MTMSAKLGGAILGGALALAVGLGAAATAAAETIRFAVTDIAGLESLQTEFGGFKAALEQTTGAEVKFFPVSSRTAAVEAMNSKQVDFVLTGPAEYVVFRSKSKAAPVIGWQRPDYFAQVVVMADSRYQIAADLKGSKIAFGDVGSTSAHLGPAQALADLGLMPGTDYTPMNISRNVAVEGLIRGDIAAVGMNFTHLQKIRKAFPDHGFRVIARGRDLPNDILVAGPHVPEATVAKMRAAFTDHAKMLMAAILTGDDNKKYSGGVFLPKVADQDYNYVRSMYHTIGVTAFDSFVGN
ncbi:PhnD/SsuA/transferrin family substrate-binding protein [Thalassobaculum sp.]|uniref:PhnD/SsuA/transferrin family substrate-binding protein n=1 Tax=Thalassobaculum sp. TaxID=2022740 RepID=UPI0032ED8D48